MSLDQLMPLLKFTPEELALNRLGRMSAGQKRRTTRGALVVFAGVVLLALLLSAGLIAIQNRPIRPRIYVGAGLLVGLATAFGLWFYLRARAAATGATVERVTGTVHFDYANNALQMSVAGKRFTVPPTFRQAFQPDTVYHVYYSPRDMNPLSAEPAPYAQPAGEAPPETPPTEAPAEVAAAPPAQPTAEPSPDPDRAKQLIAQANQHYAAGDYPEAIRLYRQGIAAHPIPAYRSFNLVIGEMFQHMRLWDEAIAAYQEVLDAFPDHDQAWQSLAECFMMTGDEEQALEAAEEAIQLNPEDARSYYNAAMLHAKRDEHEQARAYVRHVLQLDPGWRESIAENALLRSYLTDNDI